jgi:MFS family permease
MLLSLVIAVRGDRIGRRRLLVAGSLLMLLAVVIPATRGAPAVLVLIGLTGMIAVTANESTGLHSVDQAILPQTVADRDRTSVFAVYGVIAFVTSALGSASLGPIVALAEAMGLTGPDRYAPAFFVYALAGLAAAGLAARLDARAEAGERIERGFAITRSRSVVARLSALFAIDSFASGLIVHSFLAYVFAFRFGLEPGEVGGLFFVGSILSATSLPIAARISRHIGLIRTMVFTHIPASFLLIAIAFVPPEVPGGGLVAGLLYLARSLLSSMDIPARQSYVMAVVDPAERTATAGVTSLVRGAATAAAPLVGGAVFVPLGLVAPLVACGVLKIGYDLMLFVAFRARPAPEEIERRGLPAD